MVCRFVFLLKKYTTQKDQNSLCIAAKFPPRWQIFLQQVLRNSLVLRFMLIPLLLLVVVGWQLSKYHLHFDCWGVFVVVVVHSIRFESLFHINWCTVRINYVQSCSTMRYKNKGEGLCYFVEFWWGCLVPNLYVYLYLPQSTVWTVLTVFCTCCNLYLITDNSAAIVS